MTSLPSYHVKMGFVLTMVLISSMAYAQLESKKGSTWAERIGFPKGKKVIILHADDVGMCEEANIATKEYLSHRWIQSAAIMMPCPFAADMIAWAKKNPRPDIGLHLTLTSEWKTFRWGPVSDPANVPTLIDPAGKLWPEVPDVVTHATADDVEKEIRAQIDKSIALGYRPNHIDTHMGTLYGHPDYVKAFLRTAEAYHIPANVIDVSDSVVLAGFRKLGYPITDEVVKLIDGYTLPKLDYFTSAPEGSSYEEKIAKFEQLIRSLQPGLTEIIFHPSVETENLKTITNAWQQRVWEARMFKDPALISYLKDQGVVFTNWKEIMNRFESNK